jgi:hypothetical protein
MAASCSINSGATRLKRWRLCRPRTTSDPPGSTQSDGFPVRRPWLNLAVASLLAGIIQTVAVASVVPKEFASLRLPGNVPPVIGAWFPQEPAIADPEGYRDFLDAAAAHSHFNLLTTTMRDPYREMVDPFVHDWFQRAAIYAKRRGMVIALELDARHSLDAFRKRYPDEMQERLWLKESDLGAEAAVTVEMDYGKFGHHGDAIVDDMGFQSIKLERAYSYVRGSDGIAPTTVKDITATCRQLASKQWRERWFSKMSVVIPSTTSDKGRKVCLISRVTMNYPAVFGPHLIPFEEATIKQYADLPLAGLMKDEWGFPAEHEGNPQKDGYWFSRFQAAAYAKATGGRDLVRDSLLMWAGEVGRERERQAAINHVMEMHRARNAEVEQAYYRAAKATFGPKAFVGTHPTSFPVLDSREFERNGLDWWAATRDFAQTDETTPYCVRTALAKKFGGAVWYNQWYKPTPESYEKGVWSYALTGGRMNFHVLFPLPVNGAELSKALLRTKVSAADCRVRLLNFISDAPVNCPVAVIFGHAAAMNWAGPSYHNAGTELTDALWRAGIYTDLIPSSEIGDPALRVGKDGYIWYGRQRYEAVVLHQPEFENASTATFFQQCANGKTTLYRLGDWTKDFNARPFDGNAALPAGMRAMPSIGACASAVLAEVQSRGCEPQTPATNDFPRWNNTGHTSADMPSSGRCRLTDGTVILACGARDPLGDPIQQTIEVGGQEVTFDTIGVAAVRMDHRGKVEALAAGGLRCVTAGDLRIELPNRADVALWRRNGKWEGVLQGCDGPVPEPLVKLTKRWLRLKVPRPLPADK